MRDDAEGRFSDFFRAHHADAVRYVRGRSDDCDAEALASEAFLVLWRRHLRGLPLSRASLIATLRNKLGDHYRSARHRRERPSPVTEPGREAVGGVEDRVAADDEWRQHLRRLRPDHAEALVLTYWLDFPTAEAASAVGIRPAAFRKRLQRARDELSIVLTEHGWEEGHGSR